MPYTSKSLSFDGVSKYVTMGNVLAFERTQAFSVSFWFKTTDVTTPYLIAKLGAGTAYRGYGVSIGSSGELTLILRNDNATANRIIVSTTATGFNDNIWHHAVWTYNGSSTAAGCTCYIDGSLRSLTVITDALSATIVETSAVFLGAASYGGTPGNFYAGRLDEVSVYDKVLSAAEVTWIYNGRQPRDPYLSGAPSNLVAFWRMGEGDVYPTLLDSGPSAVYPTVKDLSGNNYSGTMTNMLAGDIVADNPGGTFAKSCLQFDGISKYVTMGNVLNFDRTTLFSLSFWYKKQSGAATGYALSKVGAGPQGYSLYISTVTIAFELYNTVGVFNRSYIQPVGGTSDGLWHHIVATWNGDATPGADGIKIYFDGALGTMVIASNTLGSNPIANSGPFLIGQSSSSLYFPGKLDEMAIYNRQLSAAEVAWIYNSGVPRDLKAPEAPTWLAAWWRLGESAYPGTMTSMAATDISNNTVYSNAAPVLDYAWRFKNNQHLVTTGTRIGDFRQLLLAMKNSLKTASGWTDSTGTAATLSTPWTVVASSNGTVANTSDNWSAAGDLVWATPPTAHSWIVLRQTGINGLSVEICIDLSQTSNDYTISLSDSYGVGFNVSSPTVNNRPTATDERIRYTNATWTGLSAAFSGYLNVAVSNGGECTRLFLFTTATCRFLWVYDKPKNPVSGWTNPCALAPIGNSLEPLYTAVNDNAYMSFRANGLVGSCYMSTEFYVDGAIGQRQTTVSDVTSEWPITRIGLMSGTPGLYGRMGEMSDMWFGDVTPVNGDTYPAAAPLKQFIQVGDLVLPWDRSTPVTT